MKNLFRILLASALGVAVVVISAGCNAMNDNPISTDKMMEIRKSEGGARGGYKPDTSNRPANAPAPAKGGK